MKKHQRKEAAALLSGSSSVLEHMRTTSGAVRRSIKLQKFCRLIAHRAAANGKSRGAGVLLMR